LTMLGLAVPRVSFFVKHLGVVLTHTLPPPPPGACGMVDGPTGSALVFDLAVFLSAFLSAFEVSGALAGAACARHIVDSTPSSTAIPSFVPRES
jgi:hypothetical protein